MVTQMILQVVFVLGDKGTLGTSQQPLWLDMSARMFPEIQLCDGAILALLATISLYFALRVDLGSGYALFILVTPARHLVLGQLSVMLHSQVVSQLHMILCGEVTKVAAHLLAVFAHQVIVERAPGTTTLTIVSSLVMK